MLVTFSITSQQNCRPKVVNWLRRSRNTTSETKVNTKIQGKLDRGPGKIKKSQERAKSNATRIQVMYKRDPRDTGEIQAQAGSEEEQGRPRRDSVQ